MKVVIDAFGGDYAPYEIVLGTVKALQENENLKVVLVGDKDRIIEILQQVVFLSDRLEIVHAPDVIANEDESVDSEEVNISSGKIVLSPKTKRINIKYTGISFISSEQVTFKVKLDGFDKDYSDWTTFRTSTYTNLKPGTYKFNVIAQNGDEIGNEIPETLIIVKKPYLWQRPWFIAICIIVLIAIIAAAIFRKLYKLRKEKEIPAERKMGGRFVR